MIETLQTLFDRDLARLSREIDAFAEPRLWETRGDVKNSAGNLCLHLCGNLRYYIGALLGGSGYVRNREAEFSSKDVPKKKLLETIHITSKTVQDTLQKTTVSGLDDNYPVNVFGKPMTVGFFLVHLTGHLTYHLGQINYLRRI